MSWSAGVLGVALMTVVSQTSPLPKYIVHRAADLPDPSEAWDSARWASAETLTIDRFHPASAAHRPKTQVRLLHTGREIAVIFRVEDNYVLVRQTEYQSPTHKDSCVEFFARPKTDRGYFNFEFNAIGTLLLWYVEQPRGPDGQFGKYTEVPRDAARTIRVRASLSGPIRNEIATPTVWTVSYRVPLALFEKFTGSLGPLNGQTWRANFYKCANESSHPHWGFWADIGERLDFHQPDRFGKIVFE